MVAIGVITYNTRSVKEITAAVENMIYAVCSAEKKDIANYTAGDVLFKLHNEQPIASAQIENMDTYVEKYNKKYANVICQVDLKLVDGSYDVSWYKIELVNKDGWKVYNVQLSQPLFTSYKFKPHADIELMKYIFTKFASTMDKSYAAGQVRIDLERYEGEPVKINNLEMTYLYGDGKLAKYDASYVVEERKVDNIITFYKTKEGWKIVEINSSLVKKESQLLPLNF